MNKKLKYFSYVSVVLLILLYFYNIGDIGVTKNSIEADARKSHYIQENWLVSKDTTKSYVEEFQTQGIDDRAFVSINKQYISRVEIDDGTEVKNIDIFSKTPFVIILSKNCGLVTFYDLFGNEIEIIKKGF